MNNAMIFWLLLPTDIAVSALMAWLLGDESPGAKALMFVVTFIMFFVVALVVMSGYIYSTTVV